MTTALANPSKRLRLGFFWLLLALMLDLEHHPDADPAKRPRQAIEWGFPRNHQKLFHEPSDDKVVVGIFGGSVAGILTNAARPPLERGAATHLPDDEPWATPLAWATRRGHDRIAEILRAAGARA